jgi:hypothetical protein
MTNNSQGESPRKTRETEKIVKQKLRRIIARLEEISTEVMQLELTMLKLFGYLGITPTWSSTVAYELSLDTLKRGRVEVTIDGGQPFTLGPQEAKVFLFLATGKQDPTGAEALVGYRSRRSVLEHLEGSNKRRNNKPYPPDFPNKLVCKLRTKLKKAGYDPGLIQTHDELGIRLAYKPPRRLGAAAG